jgi:HrpA-like RNA helicase
MTDTPDRDCTEVHHLGVNKQFIRIGKAKAPDAPPVERVDMTAFTAAMGRAVVKALAEEEGDILAFLPGIAHIRR